MHWKLGDNDICANHFQWKVVCYKMYDNIQLSWMSDVSVYIDAGYKDFYHFIKMLIFFKNTCIVAIPNTASYLVIMHTAEVQDYLKIIFSMLGLWPSDVTNETGWNK